MVELKAVENFELETVDEPSKAEDAGMKMLLLGLKALSQRALVALSACFTLVTVVSAFVLWWSVLPNPTVFQLVGLGLYAVFILAIHLVRK